MIKLFVTNNANYCIINYNAEYKELSNCFYMKQDKSIIRFVSSSDGHMIQSEEDYESTLNELKWIENNLEEVNLSQEEIVSLYNEAIELYLTPLCARYKKEIEELKSSISNTSLMISKESLEEEYNLAYEKARLEQLEKAISIIIDMVNNRSYIDETTSISYTLGDRSYSLRNNYVSTTETEVVKFYLGLISEINNISEIKLIDQNYEFSGNGNDHNFDYVFQGEDLEILKEKFI